MNGSSWVASDYWKKDNELWILDLFVLVSLLPKESVFSGSFVLDWSFFKSPGDLLNVDNLQYPKDVSVFFCEIKSLLDVSVLTTSDVKDT